VVDEQPAPGEFVDDAGVADQGGDWVGTAPLDDDAMLAPPPDASQFGGPVGYKSPAVRRRAAGPEFKQTMIPILLTCGVLLLVFGALKFVLGPDSPYSNLAPWVTIMVFAMGVALLGLAVFTMLQVQDQLRRAAEQKR
jgi:hypothetical protein